LVRVCPDLNPESVVLDISCVGFIGKADGHPMDHLKFYEPDNPTKSFSMKRRTVSTLLTPRYCEYWTRVIAKDDESIPMATKAWADYKASI